MKEKRKHREDTTHEHTFDPSVKVFLSNSQTCHYQVIEEEGQSEYKNDECKKDKSVHSVSPFFKRFTLKFVFRVYSHDIQVKSNYLVFLIRFPFFEPPG